LELVLDPELDVMTLAPLFATADDKPNRRKKRRPWSALYWSASSSPDVLVDWQERHKDDGDRKPW